MEKLTGNESALPQLKTSEISHKDGAYFADRFTTGGLTVLQEFSSRQMAAYRSNPAFSELSSADIAVFAVNDGKALIRALNLPEINRGSEGLLKAVRQVQEGVSC